MSDRHRRLLRLVGREVGEFARIWLTVYGLFIVLEVLGVHV